MKRQTIPSQAGGPDQQSGLAVSTMPFPGSHSRMMKGPVPTVQAASVPKRSPAASVLSLSRMEAPGMDRQARNAS